MPIKAKLIFLICCIPFLVYSQKQVGQTVYGVDFNLGRIVDISGDGNVVCTFKGGHNSGSWIVFYELKENIWRQKGQQIFYSNNVFYCLDVSMNYDGTTSAISDCAGSLNLGNKKVAIYFFDKAISEWKKLGEDIQADEGDFYNDCLNLSRDGRLLTITEVVKSSSFEKNYYRLRLFEYFDDWYEISNSNKILSYNLQFPTSGSSDGKTIVTGDGFSNIVQVFEFINNEFERKGNIIQNNDEDFEFGLKVSLSGDGNTVAILSTKFVFQGQSEYKLYFYRFENGIWNLQSELGGQLDSPHIYYTENVLALNEEGTKFSFMRPGVSNCAELINMVLNNGVWVINSKIKFDIGNHTSFNPTLALNKEGNRVIIGSSSVRNYIKGGFKVYDLDLEPDTTGVSNENSFVLFPNPTSGIVIVPECLDRSDCSYSIFSSTGELIHQSNYQISIDFSLFPASTYFVNFKVGKIEYTEKVVKY